MHEPASSEVNYGTHVQIDRLELVTHIGSARDLTGGVDGVGLAGSPA